MVNAKAKLVFAFPPAGAWGGSAYTLDLTSLHTDLAKVKATLVSTHNPKHHLCRGRTTYQTALLGFLSPGPASFGDLTIKESSCFSLSFCNQIMLG